DQTGLVIRVHHYPPGTSKWNKIEHRLFCHITQNWRGRPLANRLAVVELIGATTTKTALKVESALDTRSYQKGIRVSNAEMNGLDIIGDQFHPDGTTPSSRGGRQNRSGNCSASPKATGSGGPRACRSSEPEMRETPAVLGWRGHAGASCA